MAAYYREGFVMSRRAMIAKANNEHPVTYWQERMAMDEKQISELLIFMGNHHVGSWGRLVPFYRLPDKDDAEELQLIHKEFHSVSANKLNFIRIMAAHLQKKIDEKKKKIPSSERPRKKKKRVRSRSSRNRYWGRKNKKLQRWG